MTIDLASLPPFTSSGCEDGKGQRFVVNPKGYAVFYVSKGAGGYAVIAGMPGQEQQGKASWLAQTRRVVVKLCKGLTGV